MNLVNLVINLIPVIGQFADARDLAAYAYRIIFKKQYNDPLTWFGLTLSLVGVVPLVGDLAKFIGKNYKLLKESLSISGNLEEVLQGIRAISPDFLDLANVKRLVAEKWPEAVTNGTAKWNTALDQLSQWLNNIPDIDFLFRTERQELANIIKEIRSQSDGKLSEAFDGIKRKIDEILDEIGRLLNPQGELVTPEGVKVPSNEIDQGPMRIEGNQPDASPSRSGALDELSQRSRQTISNWPRELQIRINELLTQGDPVVKAAIEEAAGQSSEDAIARVNRLVEAMQNKPTVPESFTRGEFFARGGTSELFEMEGHPDLLIKPGGGRLPNEARALVEMEMIGIPSVYVKKTTNNGQNVLILQRIDGVGSKDIIGRVRSPLNPPENTEVIKQKTIDDLEEIYSKLQQNNANIGDFQFIIRRSDGSVFVNDPVSFTRGRGPSGDIRNIIDRFNKILRERNRGEN